MTIATAASPEPRARRILFASLALNLFFVGAAVAVAVHDTLFAVQARTVDIRSPAARIERMAAALPPADGTALRAEFATRAAAVDAARDAYRQAQDAVRDAIRAPNLDADAMRARMADVRTARQAFDQALQAVFVAAVPRMSPEGRVKLADTSAPRPPERNANR